MQVMFKAVVTNCPIIDDYRGYSVFFLISFFFWNLQVMLKAQDTLVTNCPIISQKMAIAALKVGSSWVRDKVKTLLSAREVSAVTATRCDTLQHAATHCNT